MMRRRKRTAARKTVMMMMSSWRKRIIFQNFIFQSVMALAGKKLVEGLIQSKALVVISKSYCPFCRKVGPFCQK